MNETYKNYVGDCLEELTERFKEAQYNKEHGHFESGRAMAYKEVLSFLINQAEVFQIKNELKNRLGGLLDSDLL